MPDRAVPLPPRPRRDPLPRLLLGALAALALVVAACTAASPPAQQPAPRPPLGAPASPAAGGDTLREPTVVGSVGGLLDVVLEVVVDTFYVGTLRTQQNPVDTTQVDTFTVDTFRLRAYRLVWANGTVRNEAPRFPGPTFRVQPGDSVRIRLVNRIPASLPPTDSTNGCVNYPAAQSGVDTHPDCFHGSNWTNIHYHGFHVTPDSTGDDILLEIQPNSSYQYAFRIPQNQSPGTHWYHPHKHGSVALQVVNGMSGAFIVDDPRGGLDSLTRANGIRERLLALQQVDTVLNLMDANVQRVSLVNGQYLPVVTMRKGEVQRWRIVNENVTKTTNFQIQFADTTGPEPVLYDIGRDGVQYAPANYRTPDGDSLLPDRSVLMAPGNRLDVFVQAPTTEGLHRLDAISVAQRRGDRSLQARAARRAGAVTATAAAATQPLFYVQVTGDGPTGQLPDSLPSLPGFLQNLPGTLDSAQLKRDTAAMPAIVFMDSQFSTRNPPGTPALFFLGTAKNPFMKFDPTSVYVPRTSSDSARPMVLDSVQTWRVLNYGQATNHPFHIHINPFQVLYVFAPDTADPNAQLYQQLNGAAAGGNPIWLDVLALPLPAVASGSVTQPGYAIIRQKYADFDGCAGCGPPTGYFVMHCHILGHEERGMMQVLEIVRTGGTPSPPPPVPPGGNGTPLPPR